MLTLLLVLFGGAAVPGYAGVIPAGPNVQVTDSGLGRFGDAEKPDIAVQGNNLYAAWLDNRDGGTLPDVIYFSRSTDGGATWSTNQQASLFSYSGFLDRPAVSVAPDGSIWIAWWNRVCFPVDGACGGQRRYNDTRLSLSTDGGQTFREFLVLDGNNNNDDDITGYPEIHAWDDRTLVLTANPVGQGVNVLVNIVRRTAPTTVDIKDVAVSEGSGNGRLTDGLPPEGPKMGLAVRGDTVCAAWEDRRNRFAIYGACSTNRGDSFGSNFQISGNDALNPRLAFGPDGMLYATFQNAEDGPIQVRRSSDNGATWDTPNQAFGIGDGLRLTGYDMAVDPGGQVLISASVRSGSGWFSSGGVLMASSIDRGQSFALTNRLDDGRSGTRANNPSLAVGGGANDARAYLVWDDNRNTQDQIWSARLNLDSTPPAPPANLRAQAGDSSIWLTWDAASDQNGVAGYHVQRATSEGGPFTQITPRLVTTTGYRDVGLDTTPYFYRVLAVDSTGNPGPPSNVVNGAATVGSGLNGLSGTIAYESVGDNIAVRSFGGANLGQERVLGQGFTPAFSLDGQRLLNVVNASGKGSVVGQGLDGSNKQTLLTSDLLIGALAPTRDPNVVGAIYMHMYPQVSGICYAFEPRVMGVQPNQELFEVSSAIADDMALSSDRGLLAYTYKTWCNAAASGGYDTPRLCIQNTTTKAESCLDGANAEDSDFVPNRATIVFSADFTGQRELWRAEVGANGALANLTQLTRGPAGQPATGPRVSTDGNWVIFTRDTDAGPGENLVLHVVRLDGDGLRSLGVSGKTPAWSGGGPAPVQAPGGNRMFLPLVRR
jgi:hypothetical protein